MNQQPAATAVDSPVASVEGFDEKAARAPYATPQTRPYLKTFGSNIGVIEFKLSDRTVTPKPWMPVNPVSASTSSRRRASQDNGLS